MELSTGLIGRSLEGVRQQIHRAALLASCVLILGPSGVGKEVAARLIHARSSRLGGRFVPVNCAAFSDTLIEAALFGHEKDAFTGAHESKIGYFETAAGGTIFLDEIAVPLTETPA